MPWFRAQMMNSSAFFRLTAVCAATAMTLSACVIAPYPQGELVYTQPIPNEYEITAGVPPPAPYVEVIPAAPFLGAIWINGYWGWSQGRHQWVPGRYDHARPGYRWEPRHWIHGPRGNWHLRGGWRR
jgi:hypothetical protein